MRLTFNCLSVSMLLTSFPVFAQSAANGPYWDWPGPWHMWSGWGMWWVFPLMMMIFMIVACVFVMSRMFSGHSHQGGSDTTSSAVILLNERFAKGEISKEEFEERKMVL